MDAETHSPLGTESFSVDQRIILREAPYGIEVAHTQDISQTYAHFGIGFMFVRRTVIAVRHFCLHQFAQVQPSNTRDHVEKNTLAVPFGLQSYIFVCGQFSAVQESIAVRVIRITLVSVRLPEHGGGYLSEDSAALQG